jgi:long-chain acyl-CoA synthetase
VDEKRTALQAALTEVNAELPQYSKISDFELRIEPFAKTPKQSIKRYLYK